MAATSTEKDPEMDEGAALSIGRLPESCVSHALSLTSPRDACRAAPTSTAFRRAADADTVWERFLSPDLPSILSRAADPASLAALSKKELFFRVRNHPIFIDGGKMSFQVERITERNQVMISARGMEFVDGDKPECWKWIPAPTSRFSEVVQLVDINWMEMHAKINARLLSPKTSYTAFLVFKIAENSYGLNVSHRATISMECAKSGDDPLTALTWMFGLMGRSESWEGEVLEGEGEGWLEHELESFYIDDGEEGEVDVCLRDVRPRPKSGLVVHGIEFRPDMPREPAKKESSSSDGSLSPDEMERRFPLMTMEELIVHEARWRAKCSDF